MDKIIDNNLLSIFNAMTNNKNDWQYVTDKQKEEFFFIINRYMSKKYPEKAQLLNIKTINKVSSMDLWYHFIKDKPYPKWFWSKSEKSKSVKISEKDYKLLLYKLQIKKIDLDFLINRYPDYIDEELNFFKKIEKNK